MKKMLALLCVTTLLLMLGAPALAVYKLADGGRIGDGLIRFYDKDVKKYGYMDTQGSVVIPAQYALAGDFRCGTAAVSVKNPPEYFVIDMQGQTVARAPAAKGYSYDLETPLINGAMTASVWKKSKSGLDKQGYVLVDAGGRLLTGEPMMYVDAFDTNGLALVGEGTMPKKNAMMNVSGELCFINSSNGSTNVLAANKFYFIDLSGKKVAGPFGYARRFCEGLAAVRIDQVNGAQCWGFIDEAGAQVAPAAYDEVGDFSEGMARVVQPGYADIYPVDDTGLFVVRQSPSPYIVNENGDFITIVTNGKTYADGEAVTKVMFPVGDTSMVNFIDAAGEFTGINSFDTDIPGEQFSVINGSGLYGVVDGEGREVTPAEYEWLSRSADGSGILLAKKDGLYGYLAPDGSVLVEPVYDKASTFDGVGIVWKGEVWDIYQPDGSKVMFG